MLSGRYVINSDAKMEDVMSAYLSCQQRLTELIREIEGETNPEKKSKMLDEINSHTIKLSKLEFKEIKFSHLEKEECKSFLNFECLHSVKHLVINDCGTFELTTLPPNLEVLECCDNEKIDVLDCSKFPDTLHTVIFKNNHCTIAISIKESIKNLDLHNNNLTQNSFTIPKHVINLDISYNVFQGIPAFDSTDGSDMELRSINIGKHRGITSIDSLACISSLEHIYADDLVKTTVINKLPKNLKTLSAIDSRIREINCELNEGLEILNLHNCCMTKLPKLPESLRILIADKNILDTCPNIPNNIEIFNISENSRITEYPEKLFNFLREGRRIKINERDLGMMHSNMEDIDEDDLIRKYIGNNVPNRNIQHPPVLENSSRITGIDKHSVILKKRYVC